MVDSITAESQQVSLRGDRYYGWYLRAISLGRPTAAAASSCQTLFRLNKIFKASLICWIMGL